MVVVVVGEEEGKFRRGERETERRRVGESKVEGTAWRFWTIGGGSVWSFPQFSSPFPHRLWSSLG